MTQTDMPRPGDIAAALGLLSRLPVPLDGAAAAARGARAAWAWPVAGAVLGGMSGLAGWGALALGVPVPVAAGLSLAIAAIVTGGLHEDGLADSADGLWGGWTVERRLEIMKDSHIGSYGVIALLLSFGLRWSALAALMGAGHGLWALVACGALSRLSMVALAHRLPHARPGGLSARVGRPSGTTAALGLSIAALVALACLGGAGVAALVATAAATLTAGAIARAKLGGQTGDILGAAQQLTEAATLVTLCAVLL